MYEAYATVALHDGDMAIYRRAVGDQVRTLRDNLPAGDPARDSAAIALGDMWVKLGDARQAEQSFLSAEHDAQAKGNDRLATLMAMRRVWLATAMKDDRRAPRMLMEIEARPAAGDPAVRTALTVLRRRIAANRDDDMQVDRLIATLARGGLDRPVLISAQPYRPTAGAEAQRAAAKFGEVSSLGARSTDNDPIQWADMGFWIKPDGHTDQIERLRGSTGTAWTAPILQQIAGRRYTPTANPPSEQGYYQIERVSLRNTYAVPIGSLIRRRAAPGGIAMLDLTDPETVPVTPR